ncbi:MAG: thiamine phosphate synthase [Aquimonas sp.]|nr:thiamine phosphate synthase [Aquimonas sp.]
MALRGVYLITPNTRDTTRLLDQSEAALAAGLALLQYRSKSPDQDLRRYQAEALLQACRRHHVPLIINDDVPLALAIGAAGVHLGSKDGSLSEARHRLGSHAVLGASCYASIENAHEAKAQGASYVAFGTFGPSPTKPAAARADPLLLTEAAQLGLPRVAIGGITPAQAPALVAAGADLLAVISHVYESADPAAAVRELRVAFPEFQG